MIITEAQAQAKARVESYMDMTPLHCFCGHMAGWDRQATDRCGFELTLRVCDFCGTVRQNPAPSEEMLTRFYSSTDYRDLYSPNGPELLHQQKIQWGKHQAAVLKANGVTRLGTVYDVGCGTGGVLVGMADIADRLIGCDIGAEYLGVAPLPDNVELREGGTEVLTKWLGDYVMACHTLEHRRDLMEAIFEHRSLLADGGTLAVALPMLTHIRNGYQLSLAKYVQLPHLWMFTDRTLRAALEACRLTCIVSWNGTAMARLSWEDIKLPQQSDEAPRAIAEIHEYLRNESNMRAMEGWFK